jgi:hypothetical protein
MIANGRTAWTNLTDAQLLAQCAIDTYRASGPGGQKRNKTSSAVRLRHLPSGLIVIAEESRSQHENKARALRRLRQAFFLKIRHDLQPEALERAHDGPLPGTRKDPRFWPLAGLVLDVLETVQARVSEAAAALGVSTGQLIDFLQMDPQLWQQANQLRAQFKQKPLH